MNHLLVLSQLIFVKKKWFWKSKKKREKFRDRWMPAWPQKVIIKYMRHFHLQANNDT